MIKTNLYKNRRDYLVKKEQLKILMLEDSSADAEFVQRQLLRHGMSFTCEVVDKKSDFINALHTFAPHLILSDHSLPQFNSVEALKITKKISPDIPFILITGAVSDEFAVDIIKQGADDYILKDKLTRLPAAIESALKHSDTERERKRIFESLIKSERQLKQKVDELNLFIYKLSHDIRGPVATMKGLLHIAGDKSRVEERIEEFDNYLLMMNRSADKLDNSVTTLIKAVETIESPVEVTEIDLSNCVEKICAQLSSVSGFERIHFDFQIKNSRTCYSDREKLCTVLHNIIDNAIKYQKKNAEQPYVSIHAEDDGNGIKLTIEDNGEGIPEKWRTRVFDMFTRANASSTGSGLGLYIAKTAIEKLNGSIHLESEIEKGTKVCIIIDNLQS